MIIGGKKGGTDTAGEGFSKLVEIVETKDLVGKPSVTQTVKGNGNKQVANGHLKCRSPQNEAKTQNETVLPE